MTNEETALNYRESHGTIEAAISAADADSQKEARLATVASRKGNARHHATHSARAGRLFAAAEILRAGE